MKPSRPPSAPASQEAPRETPALASPPAPASPIGPLTLHPIGVVHSPFRERASAPRQARSGAGETGEIELFAAPGIEDCLSDLDRFRYIWVLFWFHHNEGYRPKVLPPRSSKKRGVFATRSPHRPNPIGLSAVELLSIAGRTLCVRNLDLLDQTPVLDIKPYIPYADAIADAGNGWLDDEARGADPLPAFRVEFSPRAELELAFLEQHGRALRQPVLKALQLGPQPHAYRRIKRTPSGYRLAHKEWRFDFQVEAELVTVTEVRSGYTDSALARMERRELDLHRAFMQRFFPRAQ